MKRDLSLYQHNLQRWFLQFAKELKSAPAGNPMDRLLGADSQCNPYFVTFALYWYRVPGRTLIEKGHRDARNALALARTLPNRLRKDAAKLVVVADFKFPPPWGRQLRERRILRSPSGSPSMLKKVAEKCELGARLVEDRVRILRELSSGKRRPRNYAGVLLWLHMTQALDKSVSDEILPSLLDCANAAFGTPQVMEQSAKFELAAKRYKREFPEDFKRRQQEAKRNRQELPATQMRMWRRLNDADCQSIVESLQTRFDREVNRVQGSR